MHLIPQSWAHLHILVSVFPSVGLIFALGFYVTAFFTDNETLGDYVLVDFIEQKRAMRGGRSRSA